jgi:hypothetical protein
MKYTGNFKIDKGKLVPVSPLHWEHYAKELEGKIMIVDVKPLNAKSPQRMQAYYFGVFLEFFIPLLRETGVSASKGGADLYMQTRYAVERYEDLPNEAGEIMLYPILEDRKNWSFKRWHDYISDCCREVNETFSETAPDSQEYLLNKNR